MTATHDDHSDDDDNRRVCNVTSSFYIKNNGDDDGNHHPIKNDAVIMIWSLSLITPPFGLWNELLGKFFSLPLIICCSLYFREILLSWRIKMKKAKFGVFQID